MTLQQLLSPTRRAIDEYHMIADGDRVAVGLSGGKDSVALLYILAGLKKFYPHPFELVAIHIDMGLKGADPKHEQGLADLCKELDVEYRHVKTDIAEIIFDVRKESNPCSLCSKMRRGALNNTAIEMGCNKLALGHHADDLIETLFLSMFYEGRLSTFSPVSYMDRSNVTLIRPMIYVNEADIASFCKDKPVFKSACPADKNTKREYIKSLIASIKKDIPFVKRRIHGAITHPERNNLFDKCEKFKVEIVKSRDDNE
ncbi:MAG: tRNA 2-thiocytidine(32) synthetase TtcA [Clostridia bacterium]|nr:tRNA 2-thiocytidine(32) synthetase TtcA [Clostridia bacterium]